MIGATATLSTARSKKNLRIKLHKSSHSLELFPIQLRTRSGAANQSQAVTQSCPMCPLGAQTISI